MKKPEPATRLPLPDSYTKDLPKTMYAAATYYEYILESDKLREAVCKAIEADSDPKDGNNARANYWPCTIPLTPREKNGTPSTRPGLLSETLWWLPRELKNGTHFAELGKNRQGTVANLSSEERAKQSKEITEVLDECAQAAWNRHDKELWEQGLPDDQREAELKKRAVNDLDLWRYMVKHHIINPAPAPKESDPTREQQTLADWFHPNDFTVEMARRVKQERDNTITFWKPSNVGFAGGLTSRESADHPGVAFTGTKINGIPVCLWISPYKTKAEVMEEIEALLVVYNGERKKAEDKAEARFKKACVKVGKLKQGQSEDDPRKIKACKEWNDAYAARAQLARRIPCQIQKPTTGPDVLPVVGHTPAEALNYLRFLRIDKACWRDGKKKRIGAVFEYINAEEFFKASDVPYHTDYKGTRTPDISNSSHEAEAILSRLETF